MIETPVLIAGGGPVGMTLALELASHGVRSMLVERNASTTRHPKMDLTNGRSMELFRRLGLVERLRAAGVPPDHPFDIVWATSATGRVLHRFAYPSANQRRAEVRASNDGTQTLEPPMRVSQIVIEPVLKEAIDANPRVDVRFGWAFESLEQGADGVSAVIRSSASGEAERVHCAYLAGCDGGGSTVRAALGIGLEGQLRIANAYMVHFRSRAHDVLSRFGRLWHLQTGRGTVISQDGFDIWTLQAIPLPDGDPASFDPAELLRAWAGCDFDFEILVANPWTPHQVIADRYVDGRVALAGDSAHQVIPTGGYGMNTGIGDAVDLGWKLAALLNGWGGPRLLQSYEAERRPIALQNRAAAQRHAEVRFAITALIAEGANEKAETLGAKVAALGNAENECWGIEHGYRYEASPVICHESSPPPPFDPQVCTPTTWPGARLPHLWLSDGSALYDHLGPDLTLLALGGADPGAFAQAAEQARVPLAVVPLAADPALKLLERRLLLVRPDHHVAWRGDQAPADCRAVIDHVRG